MSSHNLNFECDGVLALVVCTTKFLKTIKEWRVSKHWRQGDDHHVADCWPNLGPTLIHRILLADSHAHTLYTLQNQCLNYNLTFIHCSFGVIQFYPKSHWSGTRVTTISGHWRHTWVVGMQIWRLQSIIDPDSWSWTWMCHWTMNTKDYILNPDLTITIEIPRIQLCFKKMKVYLVATE